MRERPQEQHNSKDQKNPVFGTAAEDAVNLTATQKRYLLRRSLRLLGTLAAPVKFQLGVVVVLVLISGMARAAFPLLIAWAIDAGLPQIRDAVDSGESALPTLVLIGGTYAGTAIVAGMALASYTWLTAKTSQRMLLNLRTRVFTHTQRLSLDFHENYTSGRVISRQSSDLDSLRELLDSGVSALVSGVVFMVFTGISIFMLDWRSGLVLLVALIPVTVLVRWYQVRSVVAFRATRASSARMIVNFVETMTGIRAVQAFRTQKANDKKYDQLATQYRNDTRATLNLAGILQPGLILIGNLTVVALLIYGGLRVLDGALAVGVLVALLLAGKRIFQPMEEIAMFYSQFQGATAALEKVSGLLEEQPTVDEPEHPVQIPHPRGEIEFRDAVFGYSTQNTVLPRFDLHIPAGQRVAIVGETGAGKSTLAKLMARFYDLSSGTLTLDGVELKDLDDAQLRRLLVMVTQESFLFSGSVADNIALGNPQATRAEIEAAASAVGAHEFISALPQGYDSDVAHRGGRLSAGQRQLVSFARAFLADPTVLILDEATSSLDLPSEREVQRGLDRLLGERTAVIIAHRLSTVLTADRVLVVDGGRVVEDGAPAALIKAKGHFAGMYRSWKQTQGTDGT